jgi:hypothetical protein
MTNVLFHKSGATDTQPLIFPNLELNSLHSLDSVSSLYR